MRKDVILTICGRQFYEDQEPDTIELTTEGFLEQKNPDTWIVGYEESDLTGLKGTKTIFRIQPKRIVLGRVGAVHSQMIFQEGVVHESLYEIDAGALLMSVCADKIEWELSENGGHIHVSYAIVIENAAKGTVEYDIEIKPK